MIQINDRFYKENTVVMIENITGSDDIRRGKYKFTIRFNLGNGVIIEDKAYFEHIDTAKDVRDNLVNHISDINF